MNQAHCFGIAGCQDNVVESLETRSQHPEEKAVHSDEGEDRQQQVWIYMGVTQRCCYDACDLVCDYILLLFS